MIAEYWRALRRNWWIGLLALMATVMAALGYSATQKPTYQASTVLYVSMDRVQSVSDLTQGASYVLGQMKSYESVVVSPQVTQPVIDRIGLQDDVDDMADRISASTTTDSTIMEITCSADKPQEAAQVCNEVGAQFRKLVPSLVNFEAKNMGTLKADVLSPATVPAVGAGPAKSTILLLGLIAGSTLGLLTAVLADRLRRREPLPRMDDNDATKH